MQPWVCKCETKGVGRIYSTLVPCTVKLVPSTMGGKWGVKSEQWE